MRRLLRFILGTLRLALFLPARLLGSRVTVIPAFALIGVAYGNGGLPGRTALTWIVAVWAGWVVARMLSIWLRPAWLGGRRPPRKPVALPIVATVARAADAPDERLFTGRLPTELRRLLDPPALPSPTDTGPDHEVDDEAALQASPG